MANHQRDAAKQQRWREVIRRQVESGLSVRAFCRQERLTESAFFAWRRTIRQRDTEATPQQQRPAFLPVVVDENSRREGAITIELAGGRVLRLPEAMPTQRLVELVQALEAAAENRSAFADRRTP